MASQLLENIVEIHENTGKYRKNRHHLFFLCLHLWEIRLADFQTCSDTLPDPAAVFYAYFHIGTAIAGHSATPCVSMNSCWSLSNPKPFFYAPWNPIESFSVQFPWASFLFWIELMDVLGYQWYHHFQSLVASSSHPGRKLALPLRWTLCLDWTVRLQLWVWSKASGFWGPGVVAAEGASNDIWGSTIKMEEISYRR